LDDSGGLQDVAVVAGGVLGCRGRNDGSGLLRGPFHASLPKTKFAADSALEGAVRSELVSEAKFPASRENTGNFIDFGLSHLNLSSKRPL
jgi:hypothetical protein